MTARVRPSILLALVLLGAPALGQEAPLTVGEAQALVGQQQFDEAADLLERIVAAEPDNARAWALLGYAYHAAGDLDRAIPAHEKAATFEATAPNAAYNAGLAYALQGDADRAFDWLERARATGKVDMTQLLVDPDADAIRDDPRFAALLPSAAEFDRPFVEDVVVLHEWRGEAPRGVFGWIGRRLGDVDGDGIADVVTSAPNLATAAGDSAGKVYAYSGGSGELLWSAAGAPGDRLGLGVEAAGDVDGDGVPDATAASPPEGYVRVWSGRTGEPILTAHAFEPGESFGNHLRGVGDVDGDGHGDLLVGAPANDAAGEDAGAAYLVSGADGSPLATLLGEEPGDAFGAAVGGATATGRTTLVVGAPSAGPGDRGRAYVYALEPGAVPAGALEPAFVVDADTTGSQLGAYFVSVVGDVDADGVPDVYASDWADAARGPFTGRIYVHAGATGERLLTLTGEAAGDGYGIGPADAGDLDGDGHDDLVVGAWRESSAAPVAGKVYLHSGADGSLLGTITSRVMGETLGFDATGLGDVDGDGVPDLLLTSGWSAVGGGRTGRMFLISGASALAE